MYRPNCSNKAHVDLFSIDYDSPLVKCVSLAPWNEVSTCRCRISAESNSRTFSTRWKIFFPRGICLLTSWACTIGIWSTLAQLNLSRQIYYYPKFLCSQIGKNPQMKAVFNFLHFPVFSSVDWLSYAEPIILLFFFFTWQHTKSRVVREKRIWQLFPHRVLSLRRP